MRAFLVTLFALALAAGADASAFKAHYGHYYATGYNDNTTTDITHLCGKSGVTGINYRVRWKDVANADGTFNYDTIDAVLASIAGMAAPSGTKPNNTCKLWVFPEFKLYAGGPTDNPCPLWLRTTNGSYGYAPNTLSTSSVTITSGAGAVTNTSPILITTNIAHHFSTGDSIFIDLVGGNTAANGLWTITSTGATDGTSKTFTLNGSHGNGVRTTNFGKATKGALYSCKMYDALVQTKFIALMHAYAVRYDGNANFEGFIIQESSLGFNGDFAQTSAYGGTYVGTAWTAAIINLSQQCAVEFATSRCMTFLNFIKDNQSGMLDVSAAISAITGNQVCYSGPDLLPNNTSLYDGSDQTYQALIRHVGCRSNSAQNDSYSVPGYTMTDIFNFAVQGTFGTFPCGSASAPTSSCKPKVAVTKNDGLCVNSYIFWNSSTPQELQADPVIQANPYGAQWYGQCSCGGSAP